MTTPAVRFGYAIAVAFFACASIAGAGVIYTNHVQRQSERRAELVRIESDRRWCLLFGELDAAYQGPPQPTTELGRRVAAEIHRLLVEFGCPNP